MKKNININKIIKEKTGVDIKNADKDGVNEVIKKLKKKPDEVIWEERESKFSLGELNKKWYYRIIKVIWIFIFSVSVLGAISGIYLEYSVNKEKSTFTCGDGREFSFNDVSKWGIYVEKYPFYSKIYSHSQKEIEGKCLKDFRDKFYDNELYIVKNLVEDYKKIEKKYINDYGKIYNYKIIGDYGYMILFWILSIIGILFLEQVLRRIFYYIIFGEFIPKE